MNSPRKQSINLRLRKRAVPVLVLAFLALLAPLWSEAQTAGGGSPSTLDVLNTAAKLNPFSIAASAFSSSITSVLGSAIGWILFVINYIIASIFGVAIAVIAYFISVVLELNTHIIGSGIVSSGFTITLAIANLGFVLAIIVIAIMTIIRYQTYALKSTLWKLVAAAILVNFSLVISAAILNFADTLTNYFLVAINPGTSMSQYNAFSTAVAGAFAPQRVFLNFTINGQAATLNLDALAGGAGKNFGATLVTLLNIFFPTLFLIISVIALAGLFIMLLIRYVYLGILIILMPLAWLLWIFPATSGQWHKWWSKFIHWTIFAPVVIFFIYLAILTVGGFSQQQADNPDSFFNGLGITQETNSPIVAAVSNSLGGNDAAFGKTVLGSLLQMAMMVAMLFAGMFTAQAMGIMGAKATLSGATAVTKGFGTWAGRLGRRIGTMPLRSEAGRSTAVRLQQTKFGGTGLVGKGMRYAAGWAGRGLQSLGVAGGEKLTQEYAEDVKGLTKDQVVNQFSSSNAPRRMALLERAKKEGWLGDIRGLEGYVGEDKKAEFGRYNQSKLYDEIRNEGGITLKGLVAKWSAAPEGAPKLAAMDEIINHFRGAPNPGLLADTFFQDFAKLKAVGKPMPLDLDDAGIKNMQQAIAVGVAKGFSPSTMSAFFQKLARGSQLDQFERITGGLTGDLKIKAGDLSETTTRWLRSGAARNLGVGVETFTGEKGGAEKETEAKG